jgi:hypothetical protein
VEIVNRKKSCSEREMGGREKFEEIRVRSIMINRVCHLDKLLREVNV